jgi:NitT/TauT family transport system ATP-binding protein
VTSAGAALGTVLEISDLSVTYDIAGSEGQVHLALRDIDLDLRRHEFLSVVGPSGCGKTTLLNVVAGLIPYASGRVMVDGAPVTGPGADRAMVFQSAGLLPWRSVIRNVAYGIELQRRLGRAQIRAKAKEMLELVGLTDYADRYPSALSGGMQQRVNVARALAADPELLLMDEPLGALDAQTRAQMQGEILRIWSADKKSVLFVTHAIDEAVYMSDRVVVLGRGPGSTVREIIDIPFDRPRTVETRRSAEFKRIVEHIEDLITGEESAAERARTGSDPGEQP